MRPVHIHLPTGRVVHVTRDAGEFEEGKHPRADNGQFGSGGGTSGKNKDLGGLKAHPESKMREYTEKELDWEYGTEYLKYSKSEFPDAFSSREDFQKKYDDAPLEHLSDDELKKLGNSMAYSGKNKGEDWVHKTFSHRRDSKRIVHEMKNEKTAPPIVLKKGGRLRLMAGQTRLATGLALGMSVPVKVITVDAATRDEKPFEEGKHPRAANGQFGSGGGSNSKNESSVGGYAAKHYAAMAKSVKGTTAERVELRKLLKEATSYTDKQAIKSKIISSFLTQYSSVLMKGDDTKAAELMSKAQKLGYKPPAPASVAAANVGYTPTQVTQAKQVMESVLPKPASGQYSPQDTADFNDLVQHVGQFSAKAYSQHAKAKLAANPSLKLSVGEASTIVAYSSSAYEKTNDALRAGVMDEATWKHVNKLNSALDKLPSHRGEVTRGTHLDEEMISLYKPNMIVEERGFTSTSTGEGFGGNVKFKITSKSGKDIKKLSTHQSENEILFKSGTRFKVSKVEQKHGLHYIHMEEMSNG